MGAKDNYTGLLPARGVGESYSAVKRVGTNQFEADPGRYGGYIDYTEKDFESIRKTGTANDILDLTSLIYEGQDQLLSLRLDRQRYVIWTLLTSGILPYSVRKAKPCTKTNSTSKPLPPPSFGQR